MADNTVVHIGENSPEQVAYKLMQDVMQAEKRSHASDGGNNGWQRADRAYMLSTYYECLRTVQGVKPAPK
jgi:hypothetical protein